jgi:hypothetical protein
MTSVGRVAKYRMTPARRARLASDMVTSLVMRSMLIVVFRML